MTVLPYLKRCGAAGHGKWGAPVAAPTPYGGVGCGAAPGDCKIEVRQDPSLAGVPTSMNDRFSRLASRPSTTTSMRFAIQVFSRVTIFAL